MSTSSTLLRFATKVITGRYARRRGYTTSLMSQSDAKSRLQRAPVGLFSAPNRTNLMSRSKHRRPAAEQSLPAGTCSGCEAAAKRVIPILNRAEQYMTVASRTRKLCDITGLEETVLRAVLFPVYGEPFRPADRGQSHRRHIIRYSKMVHFYLNQLSSCTRHHLPLS